MDGEIMYDSTLRLKADTRNLLEMWLRKIDKLTKNDKINFGIIKKLARKKNIIDKIVLKN